MLQLDPVTSVIKAIAETAASPIKKMLDRNEQVVRVLNQLKLKRPQNEFTSVYVHALVQYGIEKPVPLLQLFRHSECIQAFRYAFETGDYSAFQAEIGDIVKWHKIGDQIRDLNIDIHKELLEFKNTFLTIVQSLSTPKEIVLTQRIDKLESKVAQTNESVSDPVSSWNKLLLQFGQLDATSLELEGDYTFSGVAELDRDTDPPIQLAQGFRFVYQLSEAGHVLFMQGIRDNWFLLPLKKVQNQLELRERFIKERIIPVQKGRWSVPIKGYLRERSDTGLHRFVLIHTSVPFPDKLLELFLLESHPFRGSGLRMMVEHVERNISEISLFVKECTFAP